MGSPTADVALRRANELILADASSGMFVTLLYAILDPASRELAYVNAGHEPPILSRPEGVVSLRSKGIALGVVEDIELEIDLPPKLPLLVTDEGRLQQVFINLLLNARQAMPNGGRLTVTARHTDEWYAVTFADTGCGIAPESIESIFEPYFTTKAESGGTGLGLAVSRDYMEALGGTLKVRSVPGQGAAFTVRLPV